MINFLVRCLCFMVICLMSGASVSDETVSVSEVQLAQVFSGDDIKNYLVSEKYDGVRAIWRNRELRTRNGNLIHAPKWFTEKLPDVWLDGELWTKRNDFETVISTVSKHQPIDSEWKHIRYMVFDAPNNKDVFSRRSAIYQDLIDDLNLEHVIAVKQFPIGSNNELSRLLNDLVESGAEGLMLQNASGMFIDGRSGNLLKLKPYMDAEGIVIKHLKGKGKYASSMGSLLISYVNTQGKMIEFKIGTGFSDAERDKPPPIGSLVSFKYHGYTSNGVPRFASFLRVRDSH
ncbi:DNA ligase [Glaciecola sp. SC05]|uniref:DNA ligase n=1 Tax=Glaciecola sp. SC05 TaxID=1987355 RepID=UPI003527BAB7